jgi:uncharacterized lipoprotein YajG
MREIMKRLTFAASIALLTACQNSNNVEVERPEPYNAQIAFPAEPNPEWYVRRQRDQETDS